MNQPTVEFLSNVEKPAFVLFQMIEAGEISFAQAKEISADYDAAFKAGQLPAYAFPIRAAKVAA